MDYKKRKKELKKLYKLREKNLFIESLPVSIGLLKKMFDYLDEQLEEGCAKDYTIVTKFIKKHQLPEKEMVLWFQENGSYCDCEILANIEEKL